MAQVVTKEGGVWFGAEVWDVGDSPLAPSAMGNRSHGWSERGLYAAEQVPSDGDNLHLIGAGIDL